MLVVKRRPNESVVIYTTDGEITVSILPPDGEGVSVRVGIDAPKKCKVLRNELVGTEPKGNRS